MKILFNLNGKQQFVEVGIGGGVTADAEILWHEQIHGNIPHVELGNMEAYDELVDVVDSEGNPEYLPEIDDDGKPVLDENGQVVFSSEKKQILKRKLRVLQNPIPSHANAVSMEAQAKINQEARAYLDSTDWYIVRKAETGRAVPQEILDERESARQRVQ